MNKLFTSQQIITNNHKQFKKLVERCNMDEQTGKDLQRNLFSTDHESDPEWQKNNLEYDLRTCEWIAVKAKSNKSYAQNLYAALCNNSFLRNDVIPILQDQQWSCSWRYAGGIVAHLCEEGDYLDWYCSGIGGVMGGGYESDKDLKTIPLDRKSYVAESVVTDEIREDLFRLGWLVCDLDNQGE